MDDSARPRGVAVGGSEASPCHPLEATHLEHGELVVELVQREDHLRLESAPVDVPDHLERVVRPIQGRRASFGVRHGARARLGMDPRGSVDSE